MDPRVLAHFDGDLSRANLSPRKRDRILAAYPPAPAAPASDAGSEPSAAAGRRTAEVLAARCPGCGYVYEVAAGDEHEGFAAGTAWADIPDTWCCPDCGVRDKVDFVPLPQAGRADGPESSPVGILDWAVPTCHRPPAADAQHARADRRAAVDADHRGRLGPGDDGHGRRPGRASAGRPSTTRSAPSPGSPRR